MNDLDIQYLRSAIAVALRAREHGNHPFGAMLVDANNQLILEAENTVITERDCTGHAETNLVRLATRRFTPAELAGCTLYTSTEPCAMCAGAIHWSQIGRVVFALSEVNLYAISSQQIIFFRRATGAGRRSGSVISPVRVRSRSTWQNA